MPAPAAFEYAIVRVVPDVVREEHVNVGAVVLCHDRDLLVSRIELDEARLLALWPSVDLELVRDHLAAIPRLCAGGSAAGPMGDLPARERFRWLVSPRNAIIQLSAAHAGLSEEPEAVLERLLDAMVRPPKPPG